MDKQQHAEIISRLDRIEQLGLATNGRVTKLESWKVQHDDEHLALGVVADMAETIGQIRRAVLFLLPFLTLFTGVAGVWVATR